MAKKFSTWNGHLPQTDFCGLRPIQVWTKTPGKFPTLTESCRGDFGNAESELLTGRVRRRPQREQG